MLAKLKSLFTKEQTQDDTEIEIDIAAASLMLEVSWSDHHVGDAELEAIQRLLVELYSIDAAKVASLIADA